MLAQAQASIANLQKLHSATQNQLFAIQSQSEDEHAGRQSELDLASAELERAQERLASLEREKQVLVQQLPARSRSAGTRRGRAGGWAAGRSRSVVAAGRLGLGLGSNRCTSACSGALQGATCVARGRASTHVPAMPKAPMPPRLESRCACERFTGPARSGPGGALQRADLLNPGAKP